MKLRNAKVRLVFGLPAVLRSSDVDNLLQEEAGCEGGRWDGASRGRKDLTTPAPRVAAYTSHCHTPGVDPTPMCHPQQDRIIHLWNVHRKAV
jgi:hypothetical protein